MALKPKDSNTNFSFQQQRLLRRLLGYSPRTPNTSLRWGYFFVSSNKEIAERKCRKGYALNPRPDSPR